MNECKSCTVEVTGKFCSNCGQRFKLERIDWHYVKHEIEHILHVEKKFLNTLKELLARPGQSVQQFLYEKRNDLVKPIVYLVITSLIYSVIAHFFHVEGYISFESNEETSMVTKIFKWGDKNSGYANLFIGVFISLWLQLFFRKKQFNLFEILVLLCFVTGTCMIIFSIFTLFQGLTHLDVQVASGVIGTIYSTWAIGDFFNKVEGKISNYGIALLSYVLGLLSFSLAVVLVGSIIDVFVK